MKKLLRDLAGFVALVALSVSAGLVFNEVREKPLSLRYQSPGERFQLTVLRRMGRVQPGSVALREIAPSQLGALLNRADVLVLDARESLFYREGHIRSALNLSRRNFDADLDRLLPRLKESTDKTLVVYCSGDPCVDGRLVAQAFVRMGYRSVCTLKGGWAAWQKAGRPVERTP